MNNCVPLVENILAKYRAFNDNYLLQILQEIQQALGYLSPEAVSMLSRMAKVSEDEIYDVAVATGKFKFYPHGRHHIKICCGTACRLKGSQKILERISDRLDINVGEMTDDEKFSLEIIPCQDVCCIAPFVSINDDIYLKTTEDNIEDILYSID